MKSLGKYLVLSSESDRGFEDIGFLLDIIDLFDGLSNPRDLLLLLLLGAEEGRGSRDGNATAKDGEGDDAGDEAEGGPEHVLDWVQVVGGLLLVLVPPSPVKGQLLAEYDGGLPPHAHGGDGDCLALVKQAVTLLTVEPEDSGQAVSHCIFGTLKNFLHTHSVLKGGGSEKVSILGKPMVLSGQFGPTESRSKWSPSIFAHFGYFYGQKQPKMP